MPLRSSLNSPARGMGTRPSTSTASGSSKWQQVLKPLPNATIAPEEWPARARWSTSARSDIWSSMLLTTKGTSPSSPSMSLANWAPGPPRTVSGCRGAATTYPARAHVWNESAYCCGSPCWPWLNTMSGNGPSAAWPSATGAAIGSPSAGYQKSVTTVRLGAPGNDPNAGVGRDSSTNVSERVPTRYGPVASTAWSRPQETAPARSSTTRASRAADVRNMASGYPPGRPGSRPRAGRGG